MKIGIKVLTYYIVPTIAFSVALHQVISVKTSGMDPWKRGGFGMFSVVDRASTRKLDCLVDTAKGRTVPCPPVFDRNEIREILSDPCEERLKIFTKEMLSRFQDQADKFGHVSITKVSIEIRGTSYTVDSNKIQFEKISSYMWEE